MRVVTKDIRLHLSLFEQSLLRKHTEEISKHIGESLSEDETLICLFRFALHHGITFIDEEVEND